MDKRVGNTTLMCHIIFNQHSLQTDNVEQGESQPQFMSLVQNLLRDPNERSNFFQVQFCGIIWLMNREHY